MPASPFSGARCVCALARDTCDDACMRDLTATPSYIACLRLRGRSALVVGGGPIGLEKAENLLACGAAVTAIAADPSPALADLAAEGALTLQARAYAGPEDLAGHLLVVASTDDTATNVRIARDAHERGMLCNIVDVPPLCSFILPAITRNGPIAIAISTSGASPALAVRMKREIAEAFGAPFARLAEMLNEVRSWAKDSLPTYAARRDFFAGIVEGPPDPIGLLRAGDEDAVRALIAAAQTAATRGA